MGASDEDRGAQKPSEQRGGTTPDEAEAREKGEWGARAAEGVVPAELGGSDAPREMLDERADEVEEVPVAGRVPLDVDTWADYEAVVAASGRSSA